MVHPLSIDSYPLSPMQAGMLFQSIYYPGKGLDIEQLICTCKNVDIPAMKFAWQQIWGTNEVLRSGFDWLERDQPVQYIHKELQFPWQVFDWRNSPNDPQENFETFLRHDRLAGFSLNKPPLMRLTLIQASNDKSWLVWTFHHILLDGRSIPIIFKQVAEVYQAYCYGKNISLESQIPYREYIDWLGEQSWSGAKTYWQELLHGLENSTPLGISSPQPPLPEDELDYGVLKRHLPTDLTNSLKKFTEQHSLTLNTLLQGAWAILLSRYSVEQDIVFGAIRTSRYTALDGQRAHQIVGLLINTLPVRVQIDPHKPVIQVLQNLRAQTLQLRGSLAEHFSLAEIQALSGLPQGIKLFESILSFENFTLNETLKAQHPILHDWEFELLEHVGYPLVLEAYAGDCLKICLEYSRKLFDIETAQRILGHMQTLLQAIIIDPACSISQLPLLTDAERHQILTGWNNTKVSYPENLCIHQIFEKQVEKTPDAIAVLFEGQSLTYAELNRKANQLAYHLQKSGIKRESIVALYMDRSLEMIIAMLAILKAGGAYLPIDPVYPLERIAFILEDSQTSILLTLQEKLVDLPPFAGKIVCLDSEWETLTQHIPFVAGNINQPQDLAYIIYTSGSTGKPKGVLVTHHNVVRLFQSTEAWYQFGPQDVWTMFHSYAFDFSVWEIWGALIYGGRIIVVPYLVSRSPETFHQMLVDEGVTILNQTPSAFYQLIRADENAGSASELKLRFVIFGGEALDLQALRPWFDRHAENRPQLVNMYGITETTVHVTYRPICYSDLEAGQGSVIGVPLPDLQVYLLDQQKQLCPVGITGEIYVGGGGVARGYLNRPELTAERFIPNPFAKEGGSRLYKSGDLARRLPNGELIYLGRADSQVKIRGFRVELGEIEAVLSSHPHVQNATVITQPDPFGNTQLIAYLVPKLEYVTQKEDISVESLREVLKSHLPAYMIPAAFVILDSFPLTPNGKIDRKALPKPEVTTGKVAKNFDHPQNPVEEILAGVWSNLLGVSSVGRNDNFFDLGGHSLLATRLFARIQDIFGLNFPLRLLFESPTLAELARQLQGSKQSTGQASIQVQPHPDKLPLSFAQERLWFIHQMYPDLSLYNVPLAIRLSGQLNIDALEQGLSYIVERHETLRTIYAFQNEQATQTVLPPQQFHVQRVAFSDNWQSWLRDEISIPFDLARELPIRAALLTLAPNEWLFLINIHHIATDGWSVGVFLRELSEAYVASNNGKEISLPALSIQYADFALWQRNWLQGKTLEKQLSYWRKQLENTNTTLELPTDHPHPAELNYRGTSQAFPLPGQLIEQLRILGNQHGTTLFMTLLAAFDVLLHRYSSQEQFTVGTAIANRTHSEIEGLIGNFVNTLVLRADLSDTPTFLNLLTRVRETCLEAYAHQDVPFEKLVDELKVERDINRNPLFQTMFVLQNTPANALNLPGIQAEEIPVATDTSKFDLSFSVNDDPQGAVLWIEYNTDLFEPETILRMAGHYQHLLESILAEPEQKISQLELLTEAERHQILVEWNNTKVQYPENPCITQLFEKQAEKTPDAIAVILEDQILTYRQLNQKANQLAHYLVKAGVEPGTHVAVCTERNLEMIVYLWAVLKSGGVYIPLDPEYPEERLTFMLQDAEIGWLLTQPNLLDKLSHFIAKTLCPESLSEIISKESIENLPDLDSAQDAYILYTSGSTGKPKGVEISHSSLAIHINSVVQEYQMTASDRMLQFASISFDTAMEQIFDPLVAGAAIVLRNGNTWSIDEFRRNLLRFGLTIIELPPLYLHELLLDWAENPTSYSDNKLRIIFTSGEKINSQTVHLWKDLAQNHIKLLNSYGPTETTIGATLFDLTAYAMPENVQNIPIGRPLPGRTMYILDKTGQPVPLGIPGELYIGGAGIAKGYLKQPELTAERFVHNPFGPGRLYKTGDLVRYLPDGNIEFLGRVDDQVKIQGFRIELGEIETILRQYPAIREAVVVVGKGAGSLQRLAAYIILDQPNKSAKDEFIVELRQYLKQKLPGYMVPSALAIVDQYPLTPNGKIDRAALSNTELLFTSEERFVPPHTLIEKTLVNIWSELLDIKKIGVNDNFFDLGGHSLLATRLLVRIRNTFGLELPLRIVFEAPTVSELAKRVENFQWASQQNSSFKGDKNANTEEMTL